MLKTTRHIVLFAGLLVLVSCATQQGGTVVYSGSPDTPAEEAPSAPATSSDPFIRQRILADMLYEARLAFEDNRLMSPAGDNAYDKFREVLDIEPDNEVARQGIRDIVTRYVELADAAIKVGQFDNAEIYINRAHQLRENADAVTAARQRLAQARSIQMDVYALDANALNDRNLDIMVELGEIGQMIRDSGSTFLINARTDEEGRWIYKIMREAVGGFRLRGNIALHNEPSIQVVTPNS